MGTSAFKRLVSDHLPFRRPTLLKMSEALWGHTMAELAERGGGHRESGSILLASASGDPARVTRVIYHDDLDPGCLQGGHIRIASGAFSTLWDICEAEDLKVAADVHTHPGEGVAMSSIDAKNPMMARSGHIGVIVPRLALGRVSPSDVGLHLYQGSDGWTSWTGRQAARRIRLDRVR